MRMCRLRYGNSKKQSRFICLKCLKENCVAQGLQRGSRQREKGHIKSLLCINPICAGERTKNLEVRYCDDFREMMEWAQELHMEYYEMVQRE